MLRALYSGVSGLNQNIVKLDVIGNNIANVNTVGYKSARVTFGDAFSQTLRAATLPGTNRGGVNPMQVGGGVQIQAISALFNQGNILTTGGATDLAIQGEGFFVVNDGQQNSYTRAGSFQIDSTGRLVHDGTGQIVQGYAYDPATETSSSTLGELVVPFNSTIPAVATDAITMNGNLPFDSEGRATVLETGMLENASGGAASSSTLLTDLRRPGLASQLLFAGDTVDVEATVAGTQVSGSFSVGAGSTLADLASFIETTLGIPAGNVTVTPDGQVHVEGDRSLGADGSISGLRLTATDSTGADRSEFNVTSPFSQTQEARNALEVVQESVVYDSLGVAHTLRMTFQRVDDELAWTWNAELEGEGGSIVSGGSGRVSFLDDGTLGSFSFDDGSNELTFDPGNGATSPQTVSLELGSIGDPSGVTMLAAETSFESSQNGFPTGSFVDYSIDGSGRMFALYSNGMTEVIGDIAVARFSNPSALIKNGDNLYSSSSNSGDPVTRMASDMTGSRVVVGALEQSNVDLAREFSEMIITQRAFQANSRVIQSSSEILSELMQLAR